MQQTSTTGYPMTQIDAQSALALSKTRDVIDTLWLDYCGLIIVSHDKGEYYKRISKPQLTYEMAKEITTRLYIEINRVTARTHFSQLEIDSYCVVGFDAMADWFACHVMESLISPKVWEACLKLDKQDTTKDPIKDETTGEELYPTFWYTKHKILWNQNMPFNSTMLNIIRKAEGLEDESFDQAIILRNMFVAVRTLIQGSINRSLNHLTLDHEKAIHKETVVQSGEATISNPEGIFQKIKRTLAGGKSE